jgi:hypothetical protein
MANGWRLAGPLRRPTAGLPGDGGPHGPQLPDKTTQRTAIDGRRIRMNVKISSVENHLRKYSWMFIEQIEKR